MAMYSDRELDLLARFAERTMAALIQNNAGPWADTNVREGASRKVADEAFTIAEAMLWKLSMIKKGETATRI